MIDLHILIIEDSQNWQEMLPRIVSRIGNNVYVEVVSAYDVALNYITNKTYDLAIVDLALLGTPTDPGDADQLGMELLRELRSSSRNRSCGLIVLTGYPTTAAIRQALRDYSVYDVIDKGDFDEMQFIRTVRATILEACLQRAADRADVRYRLTVTMSMEHLVGSRLTGPDRHSVYTAPHPKPITVDDLTQRAMTLSRLLPKDAQHNAMEIWWRTAQSTGKAIYQSLATEQHILGDLLVARALARQSSELWLEFAGPSVSLDIPFELICDEQEYLGLQYMLTRRLVMTGATQSRKPELFHGFIDKLQQQRETLRILIVADPAHPTVPLTHTSDVPPASDQYTAYETGLTQFLQRLDPTQTQYQEALVYQQRLTENLERSRRYGDNEINRTERAQVIEQLNRLAATMLGVSFNDLCQTSLSSPDRDASEQLTQKNLPPSPSAATLLATAMKADLERIGIASQVTVLEGADASFAQVSKTLHDGGYHILHYVGADDERGTASPVRGVVLQSENGPYTLTPTDLSRMVRDTDLRMVFLSCCLDTPSTGDVDTSAFQDTLEALARADVPIIVGYRWGIPDPVAVRLAQLFYRELWYRFDPGEALFQARRTIGMAAGGGSNYAWATPVLVLQQMS